MWFPNRHKIARDGLTCHWNQSIKWLNCPNFFLTYIVYFFFFCRCQKIPKMSKLEHWLLWWWKKEMIGCLFLCLLQLHLQHQFPLHPHMHLLPQLLLQLLLVNHFVSTFRLIMKLTDIAKKRFSSSKKNHGSTLPLEVPGNACNKRRDKTF